MPDLDISSQFRHRCLLVNPPFPTTIPAAIAAFKAARAPEHIFGADGAGVQDIYRTLAKLVHEDMAPKTHKKLAHEAFLLLTKLHEQALEKIKRGTFGDGKETVVAILRTKTNAYHLSTLLYSDDISDFYEAESTTAQVVAKVVRSPLNNDLMKNEADILASLPAALDPKHHRYFPNLLDSFEVGVDKARRRVNIFASVAGLVSLEAVHNAYPVLDPRDAAWMWNRQLEALHLLHGQGYIHGAATPDRFLIDPAAHTGTLTDFTRAVKVGSKIKAISPRWRDWYPAEVIGKVEVGPSVDVYMAAHCLRYLLDGNTAATPAQIKALIKACTLGGAHRIQTVQELYSDFKKELKRQYGSRAFRVLPWPPKEA